MGDVLEGGGAGDLGGGVVRTWLEGPLVMRRAVSGLTFGVVGVVDGSD